MGRREAGKAPVPYTRRARRLSTHRAHRSDSGPQPPDGRGACEESAATHRLSKSLPNAELKTAGELITQISVRSSYKPRPTAVNLKGVGEVVGSARAAAEDLGEEYAPLRTIDRDRPQETNRTRVHHRATLQGHPTQ